MYFPHQYYLRFALIFTSRMYNGKLVIENGVNEHISQREWNDWINANSLSVDGPLPPNGSNDSSNHGNDNDVWFNHLKEACKCSKIQIQTVSSSAKSTTTSRPLLAVGLLYQLLPFSSSSSSPCIRAITCLSENESLLLRQWRYCVKPFYWLQCIQSIAEV